jgi:hypothetical protein
MIWYCNAGHAPPKLLNQPLSERISKLCRSLFVGAQDEKMDALREDIDNLEQEAQRHEARVAASEAKVAEIGQQIADGPPAPQVQCACSPSRLPSLRSPGSWLTTAAATSMVCLTGQS